MKKNCKIVQDLLPSYIDNLTNEETNQFVEEHIQNCPDCTQIFKNMNADIKLDKINQDKEIRYFKKVKTRNLSILIIFIIIVLVLSSIIFKFYKDSAIYIYPYDKEGNFDFQKISQAFTQWITGKNRIEKPIVVSNLILANTVDSEENFIMIFSFDENEKCIGTRYRKKVVSEEKLKQEYLEVKEIAEINTALTNVRIEDNYLIYNHNRWNSKLKQDILKEFETENSGYLRIEL